MLPEYLSEPSHFDRFADWLLFQDITVQPLTLVMVAYASWQSRNIARSWRRWRERRPPTHSKAQR